MQKHLGHAARKRFGQHFLHDQTVIQRIVAALHPQPGDHLVEIGPGRGALTRPLLAAVGALDVIELDRDLIPLLQAECAGMGELRIHQADALKFDFTALVKHGERLRIAGNLPYNISTPLLFHLLDHAHAIQDMHFMLQKEVAQRMVAAPGGKDYGRLSVMLQYRCEMEKLFTVGAGAFSPPPKVESAVVRIIPRAQPAVHLDDEAAFARVVSTAFAQRRKTLRNSLKTLLTGQQIRALGIAPDARAEQLSLDQFALLSNALHAR
ncbi:MAG: 16S rRNA (adenine(1518)-N(6)/adenine(1519)-N(6))-dimethyltransferase RsmA [Gammaproteobacteria bacterium]|nr:MAG: 16S rRNA (adenine(1518)-N(6)/adenine(1519)-N(6))-dimethyltransferase RsmA [Gammaproteobacteria bacterium]